MLLLEPDIIYQTRRRSAVTWAERVEEGRILAMYHKGKDSRGGTTWQLLSEDRRQQAWREIGWVGNNE